MNSLAFFLEITASILMGSAVLLSIWRLLKGPSVPDRVVAADTLAIITTVGIVWITHQFDNPIYLDIALVYGALAFVAIVAIARTIEGDHSASNNEK
ncbi:MAG: cation:proton antiporter [Thiotrichaceae bacterium]|nr:cation:proton antiporter [Thiotrichaceae bacterium]